MPSIGQRARASASLPGFTAQTSYAPSLVWSGSTRLKVRFQPLTRKAAARLWHRARDFDRQTRKSRGTRAHGGRLGPTALQVLHTLLFDFLNFRSGQLDPSYAAIARRANLSERAVATAIQRLKAEGILKWERRCTPTWRDGQYVLEQQTNAYAVLPPSQWRGYREPPDAPRPVPGTWGDPPSMPSVLDQAVLERAADGSEQTALAVLETAAPGGLEAALAALGRKIQDRGSQ
jgi:hypothetical protein